MIQFRNLLLDLSHIQNVSEKYTFNNTQLEQFYFDGDFLT